MDKIHYYGGMFFCPEGMECSDCYVKRTCEMSDFKDDHKPSPRVEYVPISVHQNSVDHVKPEKVGELKCRI
jgi:hypothetical protein